MSADDLILHYFEDIKEGQSASLAKTISESDIYLFAGLSMDTNPAHVNEDYAQTTVFKTRIAHGMLSAGFISAVLGNRLPGPGAIYVNQSAEVQGTGAHRRHGHRHRHRHRAGSRKEIRHLPHHLHGGRQGGDRGRGDGDGSRARLSPRPTFRAPAGPCRDPPGLPRCCARGRFRLPLPSALFPDGRSILSCVSFAIPTSYPPPCSGARWPWAISTASTVAISGSSARPGPSPPSRACPLASMTFRPPSTALLPARPAALHPDLLPPEGPSDQRGRRRFPLCPGLRRGAVQGLGRMVRHRGAGQGPACRPCRRRPGLRLWPPPPGHGQPVAEDGA
nr:(R)-specific trans-2,3-enoylacyl-CoA hydratase [Rhodospirillum rubrum]